MEAQANKALHLTAIPRRSIAEGELQRWAAWYIGTTALNMIIEEVWTEAEELRADFIRRADQDRHIMLDPEAWKGFFGANLQPCLERIRQCRPETFCTQQWAFLGHKLYGEDYSERGRAIRRFISILGARFAKPLEFAYAEASGHKRLYVFSNGAIITEHGELRDMTSSAYDYDFVAELPEFVEIPKF